MVGRGGHPDGEGSVMKNIAQSTEAQIHEDQLKTILLNEQFDYLGYMPLIPVKWFELETQEMADAKVRRRFV
jgi:hypothetical protein